VVGSGVSWSAYTHTKLAKKKNCLSLLEKGGRGEPCGCGPGNPSAAKGGWGGGCFSHGHWQVTPAASPGGLLSTAVLLSSITTAAQAKGTVGVEQCYDVWHARVGVQECEWGWESRPVLCYSTMPRAVKMHRSVKMSAV
jgi:uncharacterized membrane protein